MSEHPMIARYLAARERAERAGDRGLVRELDFHLRRYGYRPDATPAEAERVEERLEEQVRPRRGRPPARRDLPPVPEAA